MIAQQRGKQFFIELDQQKERFLHVLFIFDFYQGVQKQAFRLHSTVTIKSFFHGNPQIAGIIKQKPIQSEPFFHFSFYKISLNRIPDFAVNGDGKPAAWTTVF